MSCAVTNHPLVIISVIVSVVNVSVIIVSTVDKLTCKLSAWISRDQTRESHLVDVSLSLCLITE